jgi:outer membrane murein-binding lipoprotein Lpp
VAVLLQTAILFGMYLSTRKLSQRITELSVKVETDVLPLAAKVRTLVDENAPKVEVARAQAANAGELAERTMQRVDHAAGTVHNAVTAPLRQLSALVEGLMAGITEFAGIRRVRRSTKAVPTEDMFI